jgi:uncharacterized membrane protein
MNAKTLLIASLVVNVALVCGVMFLSQEMSRLPDSTPAAIMPATNSHPTAVVESATSASPSAP